jgi:hypothetical protein
MVVLHGWANFYSMLSGMVSKRDDGTQFATALKQRHLRVTPHTPAFPQTRDPTSPRY